VTVYEAGAPPEVPAATVAVTLAVPATTVGAGGVPGTDTVDDDVAGVAVNDTSSESWLFQSDVPAVFVARDLAQYQPGVRSVTTQNPDAPVTVHLPANGVFLSLGT
jgi:hypothetical protein